MTDTHPANGPSNGDPTAQPVHPVERAPYPFVRLLYALGFAVAAWFVFWIILLLSLAQFVVLAVTGRVNEELRNFSFSLVQYLWELLAFITFVRDDQPFPIGPFPKHQ